MHYYQFNIGDYAKHTRHLTLMEDLAYRRLLDFYYTSENPLPSDVKKLSRLVGMPDHQVEIAQVLEDFFCISGGSFVQKRVADEIDKYVSKADAARANGRKGGRPKKPKITQPVKSANPNVTGSKANQEPLTTNHKTRTIKHCSSNDDELKAFDTFWDAFNYKKGKGGALKSWNKIKFTQSLLHKIIDGAKAEAKNRPVLIEKGGTPKMAQGWLTEKRWEDEHTETKGTDSYAHQKPQKLEYL